MGAGFRLGLGSMAGLGLIAAVALWARDPGCPVPARNIPLPDAASQVLRTAVQRRPPYKVAKARRRAPADSDAWLRKRRRFAASATKAVLKTAARLSVTLEPGRLGGVHVYSVKSTWPAPEHREHLLVYLHGGTYVFNAGVAGLKEPVLIARRLGIPVLAVDYRMPPEHPFPAALDDALAVYRALLRDRDPLTLAVGGSSAGGGLAMALLHRVKALGLPLPGALYLAMPWADLTKTGDSLWINEGVDRTLVTYDGMLEAAARLYADGHDLREVLLSPVYGDFTGFPPTYLVTGTRDLFLSHTVRVHRRLREAGVEAELNVYEGLSHGDHVRVADAPESRQIHRELGAFLVRHLRCVGLPCAGGQHRIPGPEVVPTRARTTVTEPGLGTASDPQDAMVLHEGQETG